MQNEQDLEKLVHAHTAALLRYCTGLLGCEADAQDAVQKTFIKAWQQRHTLRHDGTDNERAWLYRIAYRTSLDMLRAIKRAAAYPTPEPLEQDPGISEELRAALNTLAPPPPAPQNPRLHRPRPAPLNTLAPPPGSTAEPPAPPCPAPLNALVPPRLHRRTPSPSPSRAAEHAGPLPVGAPETSPEGPQHAPESPFRGHLSKSRPRSWVFRGIFRTFGCKWMQKMSFAANNIIRIS